jgi:negative regulator of sigma-B (phosphoserine phosphatase)
MIQTAIASRPMPGETVCGDQVTIIRDNSFILCAVVDGLGHGPGAERAARTACDAVNQAATSSGIAGIRALDALMIDLNRALRTTRGAAVTLLRLNTITLVMEHAGIGNVMIASTHMDLIKAVPTAGVVGSGLRKVPVQQSALKPGIRLVVYTDGISRRFDLSSYRDLHIQGVADALLAQWSRPTDDASCLVIQC